MKHRWTGAALLTVALAVSACAPSQGSETAPDASSAAPASQAPADSVSPTQSDGGAPSSQGSYDY